MGDSITGFLENRSVETTAGIIRDLLNELARHVVRIWLPIIAAASLRWDVLPASNSRVVDPARLPRRSWRSPRFRLLTQHLHRLWVRRKLINSMAAEIQGSLEDRNYLIDVILIRASENADRF